MQRALIFYLSLQLLDLVLEYLANFLFLLETLGVVAYFLRVESGGHGRARIFYLGVNGRGRHSGRLWVSRMRLLSRRASHLGEELIFLIVIKQLIRPNDAIVVVLVFILAARGLGCAIQGVVHSSFRSKEFLVYLCSGDRSISIHRHLKSIPHVLPSRKSTQETAMFGCCVSWVAGVNDHATHVSN